jgi:hypothetical protein
VNQCAKGKIKHNVELLHRLLKCVSLSPNCPIAGQERCQHHDTRWPNCREQAFTLRTPCRECSWDITPVETIVMLLQGQIKE